MPTYDEILSNKTQYPDEQTLTMADGTTVTLGALRGGYMRQQDYTRKTTELANSRRLFDEERAANDAALAQAREDLTKLATQATRRVDDPTDDEQIDKLLRQDPAARKLMAHIDELKRDNADIKKQWTDRLAAEKKWQEERTRQFHETTIARLRENDSTLDRDALVSYAIQHGIANLEDAYKQMTEPQRWAAKEKQIRDEEQKKAEDAVKRAQASQPILPIRRTLSVTPDKDAPKTFDEAAAAAENDPEIQALMWGQSG